MYQPTLCINYNNYDKQNPMSVYAFFRTPCKVKCILICVQKSYLINNLMTFSTNFARICVSEKTPLSKLPPSVGQWKDSSRSLLLWFVSSDRDKAYWKWKKWKQFNYQVFGCHVIIWMKDYSIRDILKDIHNAFFKTIFFYRLQMKNNIVLKIHYNYECLLICLLLNNHQLFISLLYLIWIWFLPSNRAEVMVEKLTDESTPCKNDIIYWAI